MSRSVRPCASWIFVCLTVFGLSTATPVEAGTYRAAKIEWCWDPIPPDPFPAYQSFYLEVVYPRLGRQLGDTITQTFDYGDGTTGPVALKVVAVHPEYVVARGASPRHQYEVGTSFVWAGLSDCCRPEGLNNRAGGQLDTRVLVYVQGEEMCSPAANLPPVVWRSGGIGDTFEIPLQVDFGPDSFYAPVYCRFASDSEAGGGANPDGLSIDPATCTLTWTPTGGDANRLWTTQVQAEQYLSFGDFLVATTALDLLLGLDNARPACVLESTSANGVQVRVQDARSGVAAVQVLESVNAAVNIPAFTPGTTAALAITGTKTDPAKASRIRLRVTDQAGNASECDPVLTQVSRETGKPQSQTFSGIPPAEHFVTVLNGAPGLKHLEVDVNGRRFRLHNLAPGEQRKLDVAAAMLAVQSSTITLTPHGKPGGSATVMIHD